MEYKLNRFVRMVISLWSIVMMAGSIKFFQFIREFQQSIGIVACQQNPKSHSIYLKNAIFQFCSIQFMLTVGVFLILEAKSMFEFGFGYFLFSTMLNNSVVYLLMARQDEITLQFIENCDGFIKMSKCPSAEYLHI